MTITEIYQKYRIPPNLQEHMLRVAAIAYIIAHNWKGEELRKDLLLKSCLLHDMGNIVKYKWELAASLMGVEAKNIEYWKSVQREVIEKYGNAEHEATRQMVEELALKEDVFAVMGHSLFLELEGILEYGIETQIFEYCDYRVGPHGVISLEERLNDLHKRYQHHKTVQDKEQWERSANVARQIEKNIASSITISLNQITDETIAPYMLQLKSYEIT